MGKWLNELRQVEEISENGPRGYRQNRQNPHPAPSQDGSVSFVSRVPSRFAKSTPQGGGLDSDADGASLRSPAATNAPRTRDEASRASDLPPIHSDVSGAPAESGTDRFEERAALIEYGAGVPREWAERFARLELAKPPTGFDQRRWRTLIDDGGKFLDQWGGEAAQLGWSALDVFGIHPGAPGARYDAMGLVPLICSGEVIAIRPDRATIRAKQSRSELTYLRSPRAGAVALWDLADGGGAG